MMDEKNMILQAILEAGKKIEPKSNSKSSVTLIGKNARAKIIGYNEIRKTKGEKKLKLEEWTNRDFAIFISECYREKYAKDWGLNLTGVILYMNNIKDAITLVLGFCDNIVFYDYIQFYFASWSDFYIKNKSFSVYPMKFDTPIKDFVEKYNYNPKIIHNVEISKIPDEKDIESSYLLGEEMFLLSCGLVLSINWLICKKGIDQEDAVDYVIGILKHMNQNNIAIVVDITKKYSPYSSKFPFKNMSVFSDITHTINIFNEIKFQENSNYKF